MATRFTPENGSPLVWWMHLLFHAAAVGISTLWLVGEIGAGLPRTAIGPLIFIAVTVVMFPAQKLFLESRGARPDSMRWVFTTIAVSAAIFAAAWLLAAAG